VLRSIERDLYVAEQPLRFFGVPVGARMTVIKLASGGVLLYSPIAATDELKAEIEALGPVRVLVAPNRWHHLFVAGWQAIAPGAETFIAQGLQKKRSDLQHTGVCENCVEGFGADVALQSMEGAPLIGETVMLHRPSRTLVCCDLVHNVQDDAPGLQRAWMRLLGGYGGVKTNLLDRLAVRDRAALRASVEKVLAWDFDRIVVAHGRVCDSGGRQALRDAYAWLLS
jgi:hypothetical protein